VCPEAQGKPNLSWTSDQNQNAVSAAACSLRERLAAEETARVATEAAGAKSAAAAAAAADALAVKEQQMAAWKDLEQASKATASQQMQLTQVGHAKLASTVRKRLQSLRRHAVVWGPWLSWTGLQHKERLSATMSKTFACLLPTYTPCTAGQQVPM
jgi:hypothetical protein